MRSDFHCPGTHALGFRCHEFGNRSRARLGEGMALAQQYARILVRSDTYGQNRMLRIPFAQVELAGRTPRTADQ